MNLVPFSLQERGDLRQHYIHERCRQRVHLVGVTGGEVDDAGLVTAHDTGRFDPGHRDSEAKAAGERAAVGDRQDPRLLGGFVELCGRYYQDGAAAVLKIPSDLKCAEVL